MNLQTAVATELPYLRRYARALSGSQTVGDAAVRETLHALINMPVDFDGALPYRAEIYRVFHSSWSKSAVDPIDMADGVMSALPEAWRQALLLTTVEGFSTAEAARILSTDEAAIQSYVAAARKSVHSMLTAKILVIEDEPIIAMHVKSIMTALGHDVTAIARTHDEALATVAKIVPELVLADISLADGSSGIDAVRDILAEHSMPVIYITAFPERLLTGSGYEPAYLITKPFEPETVAATVWQALLVHREREAIARVAV